MIASGVENSHKKYVFYLLRRDSAILDIVTDSQVEVLVKWSYLLEIAHLLKPNGDLFLIGMLVVDCYDFN